MSDHQMLLRLIWKDVRVIRPLVAAALITLLVGHTVTYIFWMQGEMATDTLIGISYAFWFMIPGFVALGVPAMLVGTEHETGTEGWLRTLPVHWYTVARAKLWTAIGAVVATAVMTTCVFLLFKLAWNGLSTRIYDPGSFTLVGMFYATVLFGFFIALLLLQGFVFAYLIRSPLVSLLVLVPFFFFSLSMCAAFESSIRAYTPSSKQFTLVAGGILTLAVFWGLQLWLARRRLWLPVQPLVPPALASVAETPGYSPSRLPVRTRPSQVVSLLWQQLRQTGLHCIAVVAVSTILAFLFATSQSTMYRGYTSGFVTLIPLVIVLSASWLGAIAFYGDTVRRRCAFFADRGISPTRIWWTRLAPPAVSCMILLLLIELASMASLRERQPHLETTSIQVSVLLLVLFAYGQLVSQWVDRPLLAFLAAPAYAFISLAPFFYLLARFDGDFACIVLTVPILLFASWHLTRPWLNGLVKSKFSARVIGYTALAVSMPCLWIACTRILVPVSRDYAVMMIGVTP